MGLIFDTSELIRAERRGLSVADVIQSFPRDQDIGISAITIAELQHGVVRAVTEMQRHNRTEFLNSVEDAFPVYALNARIAKRVGDLDARLAMGGARLDLADLVIAATALELAFSVVTRNIKHFNRVPDLQIFTAP